MTIGEVSSRNPLKAGLTYPRAERLRLLKELGFKVPWHRSTLSILGRLSATQYNSMSKILRGLRSYIDSYLMLEEVKFDLVLPYAGELAGLDLEVIANSPAAMEAVFRCVSIPGFKVDLSNLPAIYQFARETETSAK